MKLESELELNAMELDIKTVRSIEVPGLLGQSDSDMIEQNDKSRCSIL